MKQAEMVHSGPHRTHLASDSYGEYYWSGHRERLPAERIMKMSNPLRRAAWLFTLTVFLANPLFAQRSSNNQIPREQGTPPAPAGQSPATAAQAKPSPQTRGTATLETLFAAD